MDSPPKKKRKLLCNCPGTSKNPLNAAFIENYGTSPRRKKDNSDFAVQSNPSSNIKMRKKLSYCPNILSPSKSKKLGYKKSLEIPFSRMFYSHCFVERISLNHCLHENKKGDRILSIMESISKVNTGIEDPPISVDSLNALPLFCDIIGGFARNWKKMHIRNYLNRHCSHRLHQKKLVKEGSHIVDFAKLSWLSSCNLQTLKRLLEGSPCYQLESEEELIEKEISYEIAEIGNDSALLCAQPLDSVYKFLDEILNFSVPLELFGSASNESHFKEALKYFLKLGKHDKFYLEFLMLGVTVFDCRWASPLCSFVLRTKAVAMVWVWLLELCMTLLNAYFYITESSSKKNQVFYFRKRDWQHFHFKAYESCFKEGKMKLLSHQQSILYAKQTMNESFKNEKRGIIPAFLRFIPKNSGLRPILPIRDAGANSFLILKAKLLVNRIASEIYRGSTCNRSNSTLQKTWQAFSIPLKDYPSDTLYAVRVDISDAYGSIKHDLLLSLLKEGIEKMGKIVKFGCYSVMTSLGKVQKKKHFIPMDADGYPLESLKRNHQPLIEVNQPIVIDTASIFEEIKFLISKQIVRVTASKRALVMKGIAQGAALSSCLCELYYGAMCSQYLLHYNCGNNLLLRSVDDFLFLTFDKTIGRDFLNTMRKGMPDFNCFINNKTTHNLDSDSPTRILFRGIILCTGSRQLLVAGASLAACHPRYTMQLNSFNNPGQFLKVKLSQIMKARLSSLLYHPLTVSEAALVANVWRTSLSVGVRFTSLVEVLLHPRKLINEKFLCRSLHALAGDTYLTIRKLWRKHQKQLPFDKSFFIVLFLGGVFSITGLPKCFPLPKVRRILKGTIRERMKLLPSHIQLLLPKPLKRLI